ncbi:MAG: hypothetical protein IPG07_05825 [Crocinitomicaceae bacterium]|nr:hypothetical protein [Crocinitomicaceae bacterium]
MKEILERIVIRLNQKNLKHKIHKFDSGCFMVDIWKDDLVYAIQIEPEIIGISLIDENVGFDTRPDKSFKDWNDFKIEFDKMFS